MAEVIADERIVTDESQLTEMELGNLKLLQGMVWGACRSMSEDLENFTPTNVDMEVDSVGTYTGRVLLTKPSGDYLVTVQKVMKE